jgi:hypothetical protein
MAAGQVEKAPDLGVVERTDRDGSEVERGGLQQQVLSCMTGFQKDVAGPSLPAVTRLDPGLDADEYDRDRGLSDELLASGGSAERLAEVADTLERKTVLRRRVAPKPAFISNVRLKSAQPPGRWNGPSTLIGESLNGPQELTET